MYYLGFISFSICFSMKNDCFDLIENLTQIPCQFNILKIWKKKNNSGVVHVFLNGNIMGNSF